MNPFFIYKFIICNRMMFILIKVRNLFCYFFYKDYYLKKYFLIYLYIIVYLKKNKKVYTFV
uniref:Uncharacterized protein n=1 Tax=Membranoptera weeksiae TaxID=158720 RepID=A0A1N7T5L3_9FLOR|nr:hypothetical protein [Membranoptera weeksiae]AIC36834.1 hypothetical protein [Membranoptera weeksiae]